jgi:signal peptidase I
MGQALRGAYRRSFCFAVVAIATGLSFQSVPYLWPRHPSPLLGAFAIASGVAMLVVAAVAAIDAVRFRRNRTHRYRGWWQRWSIYGALIVALLFPQFVPRALSWRSFSIPSKSMEPTLVAGDVILSVVGYYREHAPQRGDLVVFKLPCDYPYLDDPAMAARYRSRCNTSPEFIKRIIGLPGDHIQIKRGILTINDVPVARQADGSYLYREGAKPQTWQRYRERLSPDVEYGIVIQGDGEPLENTDPFIVPADRYFVIGDSRDNSADSRDPLSGIGFVPAANLPARPAFVQYSTNGSGAWWQIWKWPSAIRWERFGRPLA